MMRMRILSKNDGKVTVFITIILSSLLVMITTVINIVSINAANIKSVTATRSAMSTVRADYNRYIFDRYHILLLSKDYAGDGKDPKSYDAYIEDMVKEKLEDNLGEEYEIKSVKLAGTTRLIDNDCEELKRQIDEYAKYSIANSLIDKLIGETDGKDNPVTENDKSVIDDETKDSSESTMANKSASVDENDGMNIGENSDDNDNNEKEERKVSLKDPRKKLNIMNKIGIAFLIKPQSIELSDDTIDTTDVPSFAYSGAFEDMGINLAFDNIDSLKKDVDINDGWAKDLKDNGAMLIYCNDVFNSAVDKKFDDTVLNCELEYLICGRGSDAENYKEAVNRIMILRFPFNFGYLLSDPEKMADTTAVAAGLAMVTGVPEKILKYLLAGCWAYAEGIADAYFLVRGEEIPLIKSKTNWITDFDSMLDIDTYSLAEKSSQESDEDDSDDDSDGLGYNEYLLILIAINTDRTYYRILDLIEINTRNQMGYGAFCIDSAITEFGVSAEVNYKNQTFSVNEQIGY